MAADPLKDARAELSTAPLEDWVAERGRLAKALKADGEADAAKLLAKEPKPNAAAWAVGRIAGEDPGAVADWNATAAALRDASGKQGAGDALREAMAAHRDATESLLDTIGERVEPNGRPLSPAMLERVRELLQEATADPEGLGGVPPSTSKPKPKKAKAKKGETEEQPKPDPEAEKRARHRAELKQAVAEAEDEAEGLLEEADEAETAAKDAEAAAQRANAEAREARKAATAKTKELDRLRTRLDRL